jgi:hypothetical protein
MKLRLKRRPAQRLKWLEPLTIPYANNVPQSFGPVGRSLYRNVGKGWPNHSHPRRLLTGGYFPRIVFKTCRTRDLDEAPGLGFDWNEVEKYHLDEVWWMPMERFLVCRPRVKPKGLAKRRTDSAQGEALAGLAAQMGAVRSRDGARE